MNQSSEGKGAQSIPPDTPATQSSEKRKGTGVAASPFNVVKLDLGIVLFGAAALILTDVLLDWPGGWGLVAYGVLTALWLAWRTRKVANRQRGQG